MARRAETGAGPGTFRRFSGLVEPTQLRCVANLVRVFKDFRTAARPAVSLASAHYAPLPAPICYL
jgi:hypothetical protein